MTTIPKLLTVKELAEVAGVDVTTLRRWRRSGRVPDPVRLGGPTSHPRWRAADVEAWLAAQGGPPASNDRG